MQFDFYDEFIKDKGIALLHGKIFENSLSKTEAWRVLQMFLAHYLETGLYDKTVKVFNHDPERFNSEEYLETILMQFYDFKIESSNDNKQ